MGDMMLKINELPEQLSDESLGNLLSDPTIKDRRDILVTVYEGLLRRLRVWLDRYRSGRFDDEIFGVGLHACWTELCACVDAGITDVGHVLARCRSSVQHRVLNALRDMRLRSRLVIDIEGPLDAVGGVSTDTRMSPYAMCVCVREGYEDALRLLAGSSDQALDEWVLRQLVVGEPRREIIKNICDGRCPGGKLVKKAWANRLYNESIERILRLLGGRDNEHK